MAKKGTPKNTANKAKHSRLMDQKKKKDREQKDNRKARLRAILKGSSSDETSQE